MLWNGDEYPDLTRAIELTIPQTLRAGMRPADLVRSHLDSSWCMAGRDSFMLYATSGDAVDVDLAACPGTYAVTWLDAATGTKQKAGGTIAGGRVVTLAPPVAGTGRPWVALLTRTGQKKSEARQEPDEHHRGDGRF